MTSPAACSPTQIRSRRSPWTAHSLWRGDITALRYQAVVNVANPAPLGCFRPLHNWAWTMWIHSAAGIQLRLACHARMEAQGHPEPPESRSPRPTTCPPNMLHRGPPVVGRSLRQTGLRWKTATAPACPWRPKPDRAGGLLLHRHGVYGLRKRPPRWLWPPSGRSWTIFPSNPAGGSSTSSPRDEALYRALLL